MSDCQHHSLLPHASQFERDLESHAARKYCNLDADIIQALHDPWKCPPKFLPWLAYSNSVDVWNDKWPEVTKRTVCANALELHKAKGTHGGVMDALANLGVRAEIIYWHQMLPQGEPGTMSVTLWVHDNILPHADVLIGEELACDVIRQLESSKRASIHYNFQLAVECDPSGFSLGMSSQMTALQRTEARHQHTITQTKPTSFSLGMSSQMTALQRTEAQHQHTNTQAKPTSFTLGMSSQMTTLQRTEARHQHTNTQAKPASFTLGMSLQMTTLFRLEAIL